MSGPSTSADPVTPTSASIHLAEPKQVLLPQLQGLNEVSFRVDPASPSGRVVRAGRDVLVAARRVRGRDRSSIGPQTRKAGRQ
jgi:hypothetical protein